MDNGKSPTRLWVDELNRFVRQWNENEYSTMRNTDTITELHWINICPACGKYMGTTANEREAIHFVRRCKEHWGTLWNYTNCGYKHSNITLHCCEVGEKEVVLPAGGRMYAEYCKLTS